MSTSIFDTSPDCEIVSTRIFVASAEELFSTWSEPELLKEWWGPAGFTNTFHEFDFREGGIWKFTMHGPDKGNYENEVEFIKIEKPHLIAWKRHSKPLFNILATFEPVSVNQTKLVFKMLFETAEECAKLRPYVTDKNEENFDKLSLVLKKIQKQESL